MGYRSDDLMHLVRGDHTDAVRELEGRTMATAVGDLDGQLDTLARVTLGAWTRLFGGPAAVATTGAALDQITAAVRAAVRRLLDRLGPRALRAIRDALPSALTLGVQQGAEFLRAASGRRHAALTLRVPRTLRDEAARITELVADRRDRALALLGREHVTRWSDLLHSIGAARSVGAAVRAHAAWLIGRAVNAGLDAGARAAGLARLWIAEADACVRCLAYTGLIAQPGQGFPGGLSWDPRLRTIGAANIDGPPAHPHCRCRTVAWSPRWRADGVPFPLALRREAHRSIAYGAGRPSESRATRLRAVRELLRAEPDLLPAVEASARTALRTGRFPVAAWPPRTPAPVTGRRDTTTP
jgi:hypothetical protein